MPSTPQKKKPPLKLAEFIMDIEDTTFARRIQQIAQLLAYEQDTSAFNPLEVAAAKIYLKDQEPKKEDP
jgi:hypothetical protein